MVDPTACDKQYTPQETAYLMAVDAYKRRTNRKFPTAIEHFGIALEMLKVDGPVRAPAIGEAIHSDRMPIYA